MAKTAKLSKFTLKLEVKDVDDLANGELTLSTWLPKAALLCSEGLFPVTFRDEPTDNI